MFGPRNRFADLPHRIVIDPWSILPNLSGVRKARIFSQDRDFRTRSIAGSSQ